MAEKGATPSASVDEAFPNETLTKVSELIGKDVTNLIQAMGIDVPNFDPGENKFAVEEKALKSIDIWRRSQGENATEEKLAEILVQLGRLDIVRVISALPTTTDPAWKKYIPVVVSSGLRADNLPLTLKELQTNLRQQYKTLTMKGVPWMSNECLTLDNYCIQLQVFKEKGDQKNQHHLRKIELNRILKKWPKGLWGKKPGRILIEGDAGMGKSTITSKICYDYGNGQKYLKRFDVVLFSSLKEFSGNIEEMIFKSANISEQKRKNFMKLIHSKAVKTLLVLDGFDELPNEHADCILDLIRGKVLPHVRIIVTSRPGILLSKTASNDKPLLNAPRDADFDVTEPWDRCARIVCEDEEKQADFLKNYMSDLTPSEKESILARLTEMVNDNILTPQLDESPLFSLLIMLFLTETDASGTQKFKTSTELYKGIMNFIMRQYLSKMGDSSAATADLFSFDNSQRPSYVTLMIHLGEFSLTALKANSISFFRENSLELDASNDPKILDLGILIKTLSQEEGSYQSVHNSVIGFAAAYFLWTEFKTVQRDQWDKVICHLRPSWPSFVSSRLFPFLSGLMGNEAAELFITLRPYEAEYASYFGSLIPTVCETEINDSVLSSLVPFLPTEWQHWPYNGLSSPTAFTQVLVEGLKVGKIKGIKWDLEYPIHSDEDLEVNRLDIVADDQMAPLAQHHFKEFKCTSLMCYLSMESAENKWEALLTLISSIQFQQVSFKVWSSSKTSVYLPLIYEAVTNGQLKEAEIGMIACELLENVSSLVDLLIDLIEHNRIETLEIQLGVLPTEQQLSMLFTAISKSSRLTCLRLFNQQNDILTVNLMQLCDEGRKSYKWLHIDNVQVECQLDAQTQQSEIKLLELPHVFPTVSISNLLQSYRVTSYWGESSILLVEHNLLHESLAELCIKIDETFFQEEIFCHIAKLRSLQVLCLVLETFTCQSVSVDKWLLESIADLSLLKGIEIAQIDTNHSLAVEIVEGIVRCLEGRSGNSAESSISVETKAETQTLQLQYIFLSFSVNPDLSDPSLSDDASIRRFLALVVQLKPSLRNKSLSRLEIVVTYPSALKYMSMFTPNGFASFVDIFPPEKGFTVQHDYCGIRDDDSIQNKKGYGIGLPDHRFSISFTANSNA